MYAVKAASEPARSTSQVNGIVLCYRLIVKTVRLTAPGMSVLSPKSKKVKTSLLP